MFCPNHSFMYSYPYLRKEGSGFSVAMAKVVMYTSATSVFDRGGKSTKCNWVKVSLLTFYSSKSTHLKMYSRQGKKKKLTLKLTLSKNYSKLLDHRSYIQSAPALSQPQASVCLLVNVFCSANCKSLWDKIKVSAKCNVIKIMGNFLSNADSFFPRL